METKDYAAFHAEKIAQDRWLTKLNAENLGAFLPLLIKSLIPMGGRIEGDIAITPDTFDPAMTVKLAFCPQKLHEYILQSRKQEGGNDPEGK